MFKDMDIGGIVSESKIYVCIESKAHITSRTNYHIIQPSFLHISTIAYFSLISRIQVLQLTCQATQHNW